MKLSNDTLKVLKNFSTINPSITFHPGNKMVTADEGCAILGQFVMEEDFPEEVRIGEISRFLKTLDLVEDAELSFHGSHMKISNPTTCIHYDYSRQNAIQSVDVDDIELTDVVVKVNIPEAVFSKVMQSAAVLQVPQLFIRGKDGKIKIGSRNVEGVTSDFFEHEIGETDQEFDIIFSVQYIRCLTGSYDVEVDREGFSCFKHAELPITYWIALDRETTFG